MLNEPARVVAISGDRIQLKTARKSTCNKCSLKGGCGQYLLAPGEDTLWLPCAASQDGGQLMPGAEVVISMPEGTLTRLAALFYLLPLVALLLATLLASTFTSSELWLAASACAGLLAGFLLLPRALLLVTANTRAAPAVTRAAVQEFIPESVHEN
jgi:sigma-E factor negative regulatory protein RseC